MSDTKTPSTLITAGGWLQIPFSFFMIFISAWLLWLLWPVLIDPLYWTAFGWWTLLLLGFLVVVGVIGIGLAIIWLRWRRDILMNKRRLITTAIFGVIFTGTVPGILILIGAAIYPEAK